MNLQVQEVFQPEENTKIEIELYNSSISAGFPSFSSNEIETKLDLNKYLIKNSMATYFVRVSGQSMIEAGIYDKDILIVDKSIEPREGQVVIAEIDGELTVKRLKKVKERLFLCAENPDYAPILVNPESSFQIWGVVTYVIHKP